MIKRLTLIAAAVFAAFSWTGTNHANPPIKESVKKESTEGTLVNGRPPTAYVNPFIGAVTHSVLRNADSQGKTIPGACYPYGLVQLSPDSITGGDNGSGYSYEDKTLQGFSFTHMSGIGWYGDLGNFLVMPATGELKTSYGIVNEPNSGYLSRKCNETASPGYYAVTLLDYGIRAELAAAAHSGHAALHLSEKWPVADSDRSGPADRRHLRPAIGQGRRRPRH